MMPKNDRLFHLMEQLDHADLLFLLTHGLKKTESAYKRYSKAQLENLISSELRDAASHSFANFFRLEHEFPYKQILIDVADKLSDSGYKSKKYRLYDNHTEEEIEKEILRLFELKTKDWWKKLNNTEKEQIVNKISEIINAELVNSVNKKTLIKYRVTKEIMDSIITKGIVVAMLAFSAGGSLGIIGGSLLTRIGWNVVFRLKGAATAVKIMSGIAGLSGITVLNFIGGIIAGLAVFVPSTIYFYADTNYKKIIPTIIMLLSKIHLNKTLKISG